MAVFDFSGLVDSFATMGGDSGNAALAVARDLGMTFVDGIGASSGWTSGTIDVAAVFPLDARELEAMPEGVRERGAIRLFAREALYGVLWGTVAEGRRGDVVEWQGATWQVAEVMDWSRSGGFWEAVAVRTSMQAATIAEFVLEDAAAEDEPEPGP